MTKLGRKSEDGGLNKPGNDSRGGSYRKISDTNLGPDLVLNESIHQSEAAIQDDEELSKQNTVDVAAS